MIKLLAVMVLAFASTAAAQDAALVRVRFIPALAEYNREKPDFGSQSYTLYNAGTGTVVCEKRQQMLCSFNHPWNSCITLRLVTEKTYSTGETSAPSDPVTVCTGPTPTAPPPPRITTRVDSQ